MGSGSRLRKPPRLSAYSAAKAGLWALTTTLARELPFRPLRAAAARRDHMRAWTGAGAPAARIYDTGGIDARHHGVMLYPDNMAWDGDRAMLPSLGTSVRAAPARRREELTDEHNRSVAGRD